MTSWSPQPYQAPTREQFEQALRPALPTDERQYPDFYRTRRNAWWKPLVAMLMAGAIWMAFQMVFGVAGFLLDPEQIAMAQRAAESGNLPTMGDIKMTPMLFLTNNVAIATAIPAAFLTQWAVWGQRPKWLSSVAGGFRWSWFGRCLAITVPLWILLIGGEYLLAPPEDVRLRAYTVFMIVVILLTTPFQAAGEEYLMRGLQTRAVASWFPSRTIGWIVATIVSSITFMLLHLAADPWLNVFYLGFGALASWVTWRTGGLEAAVAIHVTNNMLAESMMPFTDFSNMMDRSVGRGDPTVLFSIAIIAVASALMIWQAKRHGITIQSAPGRAEVDAAASAQFPPGFVPWQQQDGQPTLSPLPGPQYGQPGVPMPQAPQASQPPAEPVPPTDPPRWGPPAP